MNGRLDAVVEAFKSNISNYDPGPGEGADFDQLMKGLPSVYEEFGKSIKEMSEHFKANPSINHHVTDLLDELANTTSGIAHAAEETMNSHATNHGLWIGG